MSTNSGDAGDERMDMDSMAAQPIAAVHPTPQQPPSGPSGGGQMMMMTVGQQAAAASAPSVAAISGEMLADARAGSPAPNTSSMMPTGSMASTSSMMPGGDGSHGDGSSAPAIAVETINAHLDHGPTFDSHDTPSAAASPFVHQPSAAGPTVASEASLLNSQTRSVLFDAASSRAWIVGEAEAAHDGSGVLRTSWRIGPGMASFVSEDAAGPSFNAPRSSTPVEATAESSAWLGSASAESAGVWASLSERAAALANLPADAQAVDRALVAVLGELEEFGDGLSDYLRNVSYEQWAAGGMLLVVAGAWIARQQRRRQNQHGEDEAAAWLFAQMHALPAGCDA